MAEALTAFVGGDHAALEAIAVHQPGSDYRHAVWAAMREVPGIEDQRALFGLRQLIAALRAPLTSTPMQ